MGIHIDSAGVATHRRLVVKLVGLGPAAAIGRVSIALSIARHAVDQSLTGLRERGVIGQRKTSGSNC